MQVEIMGIDFTSSPGLRKPIVCIRAELAGNILRVRDLIRWIDFAGFEAALVEPGKWIAGIDCPFGQSSVFIKNMGWPRTWAGYVQHVSRMSRAEFRSQLEAYRVGRAPGDKEHRRATDIAAGSISPQKLYGVPVALMFFEGAPRILASGATIPGVIDGDIARILVEAYPGALARFLVGRQPYKADGRKRQSRAHYETRRRLVAMLKGGDLLRSHGVRVKVEESIADDPAGDDLDALLCAVQAASAWLRRSDCFGAPKSLNSNEGWIAEPTIYANAIGDAGSTSTTSGPIPAQPDEVT